jgi:translation initiation factor eIF-2B subunit epsilon
MIEDYLDASDWKSRLKIKIIVAEGCLSAGDALRELDRRAVVRSDPFVLISGDVISNMSITHLIEEHRARKKKDSSCVMTTVFKQCKIDHPSRPLVDDLVVAMNKDSGQILLYDDNQKNSRAELPVEFFDEGHSKIQFRYDLLDCHIDICSPDVLLAFSDNFDYQDLRKDFIHNEVLDFELGNKITAHVIQNEYAARIHDFRTYHMVSLDLIRRWVYPIVPDNNFLGDNTSYKYQRRGLYKEDGVTIAVSDWYSETKHYLRTNTYSSHALSLTH